MLSTLWLSCNIDSGITSQMRVFIFTFKVFLTCVYDPPFMPWFLRRNEVLIPSDSCFQFQGFYQQQLILLIQLHDWHILALCHQFAIPGVRATLSRQRFMVKICTDLFFQLLEAFSGPSDHAIGVICF